MAKDEHGKKPYPLFEIYPKQFLGSQSLEFFINFLESSSDNMGKLECFSCSVQDNLIGCSMSTNSFDKLHK